MLAWWLLKNFFGKRSRVETELKLKDTTLFAAHVESLISSSVVLVVVMVDYKRIQRVEILVTRQHCTTIAVAEWQSDTKLHICQFSIFFTFLFTRLDTQTLERCFFLFTFTFSFLFAQFFFSSLRYIVLYDEKNRKWPARFSSFLFGVFSLSFSLLWDTHWDELYRRKFDDNRCSSIFNL